MPEDARAITTMADVARVAGVSVSTVSHVVNGTRNVSEQAERAVRDAIHATGYTHDRIARSLATGRTRTIGLAMSAISNPYFAELAHAVEQEAARGGYTLLLADTHDEPERELRATRDLLGRRVDGVILAPSGQPEAALELLRQRGMPTVLIDRFAPADLDQIATENVAPTAMLVEHLAELGHERIGIVAGLAGLATSEERIEGYRRGLESSSLQFDPELVVRGDSAAAPARAAVHRLLRLERPPTALVVTNNRMTIGVMRALRDASLSVPDDIALVAFDDFEWADLFHPRLTTIAQATTQIGEQAVTMLLTRLANPDLFARKVRLEPRFVHRESCGCRPDGAGSPAAGDGAARAETSRRAPQPSS
ncbi:MAG TPA: LacI family DNA-binding transcriptional regulator [Gaiellaceae bacterium]|nr:LacI family DNA-binding transcriptional regulator [Gaiellaceae bacterium]